MRKLETNKIFEEAESSEILQNKNKLNCYVCPGCKSPTYITYNSDMSIDVECRNWNCENFEDTITYNIEEYTEEVKKEKIPSFCSIDPQHGNLNCSYCTFCNKWLCLNCLKVHCNLMKDHKISNIIGLEISSKCPDEECTSEGKDALIKYFYHEYMDYHLCQKCKDSMGEVRKGLTDINQMLSEEKFQEMKNDLSDQFNEMDKSEKNLQKLVEEVEIKYQKLKKFYEETIKEDSEIKMFFSGLYDLYEHSKDIPNYFVRFNILNNDIRKILAIREAKIKNNISFLSDSIISSYFDVNKEFNSFEVFYNILNVNQNTLLFNSEFDALNSNNCTLFIDNVKIPFTKEFKFNKTGLHRLVVKMAKGKNIQSFKKIFQDIPIVYFDASKLNGQSVKDMSFMFNNKENTGEGHESLLKGVNFTNFVPTSLENINSIFDGCLYLENITGLSNLDTSKCTQFDNCFRYCESLKELDLSFLKTENAVSMSEMFYGCKSLEKLDLSNFDTHKVMNFNRMFYDTKQLKEIKKSEKFIIPEGAQTNRMYEKSNHH